MGKGALAVYSVELPFRDIGVEGVARMGSSKLALQGFAKNPTGKI
jgi:hypothetical protein